MKKTIIGIVACIIAISAIFISLQYFNKSTYGNPIISNENIDIFIGDRNIEDYIIVYEGFKSKKAANTLSEYIKSISGKNLSVKSHSSESPFISIRTDKNSIQNIYSKDGNIFIVSPDEKNLELNLYAFINTYLGVAFAGTKKEHICEGTGCIRISDNIISSENPWINEREPIICLWKTDTPRGQYYNADTNPASEILAYTDDQLYNYIKMIKQCGFTGIQVTDMCSCWAQWGGYEYVHEKLRYMSEIAHSLDMKFTLWVWGAEFTGYGWQDDTVVYHDLENGAYGYECETVMNTFKKYYSIYSELADCSDRVIMHFDDPSNTHDIIEIAHYAAYFRDMVREINPSIEFGVSDYTDKYDKTKLVEILGDDFTVYSGAPTYEGNATIMFRTVARDNNITYGVWSWNLIEMEIDQLAEMNVNTNIIKNVYQRAQAEDWVWKPDYWSEMDAYHFANIFSLFSAGQLLINPELEAEDVLYDIAFRIVGNKYAEPLYELLCILEDARSGQTFDEFKWGTDTYIITSEEYPYESILSRCDKFLPILDEMIEQQDFDTTISLPGEVNTLLSILRTHLNQINQYANFRKELSVLKEDYEKGYSLTDISERLSEIYNPIPTYDAIIGVFGQPEAIAQWKMVTEFATETGAELPHDSAFDELRRDYIYSEMVIYQQNSKEQLTFPPTGSNIWAVVMGEETAVSLVDDLVKDGRLARCDNGVDVYLP